MLKDDLKQYAGFIDTHSRSMSKALSNKIEDEIRKRITALGVDVNDAEYLKHSFEFIERDGDDFKHLFYKPESKFIFSIQKTGYLVPVRP